MLNRMIREKYYGGLDIGSQKIKAGILRVKDATDVEIVGAYEHPTYGFKNNAVSDLGEFSECIHRAVRELTQRAGIKLRDIQLGLSGAMVDCRQVDAVIPLVDRGSKVISRRDVKKVNHHARLLGMKMEEEVVHDLPQHYRVDDVNSALNPLGLYGRTLGVHSLMITVNGNRIRNIAKAVQQAGYEVANVFLNSYAAAQAVLSEQERKEGAVLLDIGARQTSVLIFREGVLRHLEKINIGGDHFTRRIAEKINLSVDLAEEIKKSYAAVSGFDQHLDEEILVKREQDYMPVRRGLIYEAVEPEVNGLLDRVCATVAGSGLKGEMLHGITVIGGGALLSGLIERIGQRVEAPARLGQVSLPLRKNLSHTAVFSSVVGLARGGFEKTLRYSITSNGHAHWAKHWINRIGELYQEYF